MFLLSNFPNCIDRGELSSLPCDNIIIYKTFLKKSFL